MTGDGGASEHSDDAASDADEGSASSKKECGCKAAAISLAGVDARCDELGLAHATIVVTSVESPLSRGLRHGVRLEARRREATGLLFL